MFKILIILHLFFVTGSLSQPLTCDDLATYIGRNVNVIRIEGHYATFYQVILKCAKDLTDAIVNPDEPYRQCIWMDNLQHCANEKFKNIDCGPRFVQLIQNIIEELKYQNKRVPKCYLKYLKDQMKKSE